MTIDAALRAAGLTVYDTRVAPRPGSWVPTGVLWHHVGDNPPRALLLPPPALHLVQQGRADLAGPLCQWLVDGEGGWWWITDGRANHAGAGDIDVWHWLISDPTTRLADPPRPNDNADTNDGNGHLIGIEVEGNGNWSAAVHRSMMVGTKALLDFYGRPKDNVIGHKEWTSRKVDPGGISMPDARVALRMPPPPPLPIPNPILEDTMMTLYTPTDYAGNTHKPDGSPIGPVVLVQGNKRITVVGDEGGKSRYQSYKGMGAVEEKADPTAIEAIAKLCEDVG